MSLKNQQEKILEVLEETYRKNEKLRESIKSLAEYIDLEVYSKQNDEDLHVTNLIQKKVALFCKNIADELKKSLLNVENLDIKISRDGIEDYEPIAYMYGTILSEEKESFKFKKSHINGSIEDEDSFLIIIDATTTFRLIPWKI